MYIYTYTPASRLVYEAYSYTWVCMIRISGLLLHITINPSNSIVIEKHEFLFV